MDWFLYDNGLRHERVNTFQLDINSATRFGRTSIIDKFVMMNDGEFTIIQKFLSASTDQIKFHK